MRRIAAFLLLACGCDAPSVAVPAAKRTLKEDFAAANTKWVFPEGTWIRRDGLLAQTSTHHAFNVALLQDGRFANLDLTVKFRPVSGQEDASGGLVFRAADARNYYIVRANALEANFRLYTVIDGRRSQIATASVAPPKLGDWHALRVVAAGDRLQAWLNGALLIDQRDGTLKSGWVGLWTKADSVTEFDDLAVEGTE